VIVPHKYCQCEAKPVLNSAEVNGVTMSCGCSLRKRGEKAQENTSGLATLKKIAIESWMQEDEVLGSTDK
jgi:hypothetical protein